MATKRKRTKRTIHGSKVSGSKVTPRIWAENGWIKCVTPYSEEFVNELKGKISWRLRQWSPSERVWMVDPAALDDLMEVAQKFFPSIAVVKNGETSEPPESSVDYLEDGTYGTMANMLRVASVDTLKRLYKNLAMDIHPDRGGDKDTMRLLNIAWDRIKLERGI